MKAVVTILSMQLLVALVLAGNSQSKKEDRYSAFEDQPYNLNLALAKHQRNEYKGSPSDPRCKYERMRITPADCQTICETYSYQKSLCEHDKSCLCEDESGKFVEPDRLVTPRLNRHRFGSGSNQLQIKKL